jgi:hypothetical protein
MRTPRHVFLRYLLALAALAAIAVSYGYLIGFPRTIDGRRVHRVTQRNPRDWFQPVLIYYAYSASGREMKHGPFQRYEEGALIQTAYFKDGRLDGTQTYYNALGDKVQELYYRNDRPYGWANFSHGKLLTMRKDIFERQHAVAVKSFRNGQYSLEFRCGELIDLQIDPVSGQLSPIPNAGTLACTAP